jgi:hypothetical protein
VSLYLSSKLVAYDGGFVAVVLCGLAGVWEVWAWILLFRESKNRCYKASRHSWIDPRAEHALRTFSCHVYISPVPDLYLLSSQMLSMSDCDGILLTNWTNLPQVFLCIHYRCVIVDLSKHIWNQLSSTDLGFHFSLKIRPLWIYREYGSSRKVSSSHALQELWSILSAIVNC